MPHGKRYSELTKLVDSKKVYSVNEAIDLVKKTASTKFDSTVEFHANLGIDVKKSDQLVRFIISLPNTFGKTKRVIAFVPSDREKDATDAGADIIGNEEMIEQIVKTGKMDFDVAVATPDMMPKLTKLAKILGPKGLMPNPKTETVGTNVKKMIDEVKKGKITVKNDSTGNIHQAISKVSMDAPKIAENLTALVGALKKAKPGSSKGVFIKNAVLTSTMGPAIKVDTQSI